MTCSHAKHIVVYAAEILYAFGSIGYACELHSPPLARSSSVGSFGGRRRVSEVSAGLLITMEYVTTAGGH
jgi:hypothetical protein